MNNSKLAIESTGEADISPLLRERESEVIKILTAIKGVSESKEWSTLKELVFNGITASLEKEISSEARKENPDALKLNRLAGQLKWAEKYSDLSKLEHVFKSELINLRQRLHGTT